MKQKFKLSNRILSLVLTLVLVLGMLPISTLTAYAADTVTYIECSWNGNSVVKTTKEVTNYTVVTSGTTTMNDGWYVVNSDVTVPKRIYVEGNVNLILMDGCTLTASKGIRVIQDKTFNIFGQENSTGALVSTANSYNYSGIFSNGHIAIHGATVTATGGNASGKGIGAGIEVYGCGALTVYDGVVTATGSNVVSWNGCAGIGGVGTNDTAHSGYPSGDIDIYGGIIFATGKNGADDIGGGMGFKGKGTKDVTISGGLIFDRNGNGVLGGTEYTLEKNWEIPAGKTLTIESGKTLIIPKGVTLTKTGTLVNNGTIMTVCSDSTEYGGTVSYLHDDLTYSANEDTITATCGKNNLHTFSITLVTDDSSVVYDGNAHGATVQDVDSNWVNANLDIPIITYAKKQADDSYGTPTSDKPTDVGTYQASITVDGNTITKTFEITVADISSATVTLNPANGTYNGTKQEPTVSIVWNGTPLTENTDYTLSWDKTNFANADSYTVTITGKGNFKGTKTAQFTIFPLEIKGATVTLDEDRFVYDGQPHKPVAAVTFNGTTLTAGVDYDLYYMSSDRVVKWENGEPIKFFGYESSDSINAGQYYVVAVGKGNYAASNHFAYAPYTIGKATVTEPTITSKSYNKTAQTADVPASDLYTVTENIGGEDAGKYNVVLTLKDSNNYKWATTDEAQVTLEFKIIPARNAWVTAPAISGWTYGEPANSPTYEAEFGTVYVLYDGIANDGTTYDSDTPPTKAGSYVARFFVDTTANYEGISKGVEFIIAKATYDMTGAKWDYTAAFDYDGKEQTVEVIGLPSGVTVSGYEGNKATVVGNYTAKVTFSYDVDNYNAPALADLNWSIKNDWTPFEYTVSTPNGNGWMNQDFVITPADGYLISLTNTANGTWEDALTYSGETDNGCVTFYLKNETDGTISLAKTVTYKLDKTDPIGKVEFDERNGWETFLNTITFNLFYKDEVTVKVTTDNDLSSIAKIEYASSDKAMTLNEVIDIADWTEYNGSFGVTKPEAEKFVYFIRITDNAGNVTYLSTDGAQYDTTAPGISGIENGKTYYTTQKVTVTDENMDSITLNGEPADENITLEGNKEATYTIVATDKAGNETTVTVTMKPVVELGAPIGNITEDEVKFSDKDTIQNVIEIADELLSDDDLTDDEKAALEEIKSEAEKLVDKIDEVAKATDTENTEKVKDVTAENVTPEDKTDLEKAKADLEKALEDHGDNYTEDEKKAIEDEIKRIDDALEVIGNVEEAEELIGKLPENITKNDENDVKAADDALGALTDYEKSLVDEEVKKALDDAKAALAELNKPADSTSPNTGNNSNLWMWFAVLFVSGTNLATGRRLKRLSK